MAGSPELGGGNGRHGVIQGGGVYFFSDTVSMFIDIEWQEINDGDSVGEGVKKDDKNEDRIESSLP